MCALLAACQPLHENGSAQGVVIGAVTPWPKAVVAAFLLWKRKLYHKRWMLWILMLSFPFPYIANTAGWMTAELGRQPWLIYGLMRTAEGVSPRVAAGNAWFTLIGFMGMYAVLAVLWLFLIYREIEMGPEPGRDGRGDFADAPAD